MTPIMPAWSLRRETWVRSLETSTTESASRAHGVEVFFGHGAEDCDCVPAYIGHRAGSFPVKMTIGYRGMKLCGPHENVVLAVGKMWFLGDLEDAQTAGFLYGAGAVIDAQLAVDGFDVKAHGVEADVQAGGDLRVL